MRTLFMGTPQFAAVCLSSLLEAKVDIIGVITQPDRPKGRGMLLEPSEVKTLALEYNLPIWQPARVNESNFINLFRELKPELVVVVAFGQKIPPEILFEPKHGCINVHGSLLPQYRGAAPIQWALWNGDPITGVTTMYMNEGWDTGDIIYQEAVTIDPNENFESLYKRLAQLGGQLLIKTISAFQTGKAPRIVQDETKATRAPKLTLEQHKIDWSKSAQAIHNQIRTLTPTPGAETNLSVERLKIIESSCETSGSIHNQVPGQIIEIVKNQGILVTTGDKSLLITKIQPAGKKIMTAYEYSNGKRLTAGMIFGQTTN